MLGARDIVGNWAHSELILSHRPANASEIFRARAGARERGTAFGYFLLDAARPSAFDFIRGEDPWHALVDLRITPLAC
jgi:hypothetical protein